MNGYLNKTFVIDDPGHVFARARIYSRRRQLMASQNSSIRTQVKITDAKVFKDLVFVRVDGFGWTSKAI
jgi:hypothetical protein